MCHCIKPPRVVAAFGVIRRELNMLDLYSLTVSLAVLQSGALLTPWNAEQVTDGMPLVRVVAVVGLPGDYRTRLQLYEGFWLPRPYCLNCLTWRHDDFCLEVHLGRDGRVVEA